MLRIVSFILGIALLSSCSSYLTAFKEGTFESNMALRQMSQEVDDLKQALQDAQLEILALEDRLQSQEGEFLTLHNKVATSQSTVTNRDIAILEKKVNNLEEAHLATLQDIKSLHTYASTTSDKVHGLERQLGSQGERLQEVVKLKGTLTSISQAMRENQNGKVYEVQPGDTLGKIAYSNKITIQALKAANNLTSNRIYAGQKLNIP